MSGDMWLSYLGGGVLLAYPEVSSVAQHPLLLRTVYHNTYLPHRVSSVKAEKPWLRLWLGFSIATGAVGTERGRYVDGHLFWVADLNPRLLHYLLCLVWSPACLQASVHFLPCFQEQLILLFCPSQLSIQIPAPFQPLPVPRAVPW